jgi:hypothetical protein
VNRETVRRVRERYLDQHGRRCGLDAQWCATAWDFGGGVYILDSEDADGTYVLVREITNADGETIGASEIFYTTNVRRLARVARDLAASVSTRNLDLED